MSDLNIQFFKFNQLIMTFVVDELCHLLLSHVLETCVTFVANCVTFVID